MKFLLYDFFNAGLHLVECNAHVVNWIKAIAILDWSKLKKPIFNSFSETAVDEKRKDLLLAFGLIIASAFKLGVGKPDAGLNYITKQQPRNFFTFQKICTILKAYFMDSFQK